MPQPLPLTLGSDLSGDIVDLGQGVSDLREGDQVYGVTNPRFVGAYAEYAVASAAMISRKPTSLTYIEECYLSRMRARLISCSKAYGLSRKERSC